MAKQSEKTRLAAIQIDRSPFLQYLTNLGFFIEKFALAEMALVTVLHVYAKTKVSVSRALFSGTRVDGAVSFIRRIMEVTEIAKPSREDMEDVLDQIMLINGMRNHLVHYGTILPYGHLHISNEDLIVSNEYIALTEERIVERRINKEIIYDMCWDLEKIYCHLLFKHAHRRIPSQIQDMVRTAFDAPWRYKPPSSPRAKSPKSGKKDRAKGKVRSPPPDQSRK